MGSWTGRTVGARQRLPQPDDHRADVLGLVIVVVVPAVSFHGNVAGTALLGRVVAGIVPGTVKKAWRAGD